MPDEEPSRETALILRIVDACQDEPDAHIVAFALCAALMGLLAQLPKSFTTAAVRMIEKGKPPPLPPHGRTVQ